MQVGGNGVDLFGLYGLAFLTNIAAALWGAASRCACARCRPAPLMQMPVFLTLFLAPVYVPLSLLSGWIAAVASVNPATALLETGRGFISGDETGILLAFGAGLGLILVFAVWGWSGLRSAERAGA